MNELKVKEREYELTPIEIALQIDEEGRTTTRKLYEFLELDKSHYSRWIKKTLQIINLPKKIMIILR